MNTGIAHQKFRESRNDHEAEGRTTFEARFPLESFQSPLVHNNRDPTSPPPFERRRSLEALDREGITDSTLFRKKRSMNNLLIPDFDDKYEQSKSRRTVQFFLRPRRPLQPSQISSTPYVPLSSCDKNQQVILPPSSIKNVESRCSRLKRKCSLDNIGCPQFVRPPMKLVRRASNTALSA